MARSMALAMGLAVRTAPPMGLGQRKDGEAFGDGAFEPGGALWRALGVSLDEAGELGLGCQPTRCRSRGAPRR